MTAQIAILNRNGVALATDSIATVNTQEGQKFITVEKLFSLSKHHPVAIMIYGSADFTDIPFETIVKVYTSCLRNKPFDTLEEYADDFFRFLAKDKRVYNSGYEKRLVRSVLDYCLMENMPRFKSTDKREQTLSNNVNEKIKAFLSMRSLEGIGDNFIQSFLQTHGDCLKRYMSEINNIRIDKKTQENIVLLCAHMLSKSDFLCRSTGPSTGVVIAGYGNKEIFPSLIEYKITGVVSENIIYEPNGKHVKVGFEESETESTFMPFAQRDVVDTYTKGIDEELETAIFDGLDNFFNNFYEAIQEEIQRESNKNLTHEFTSEERAIIKRLGEKKCIDIKDALRKEQSHKYTEPFLKMGTLLGREEMIFLAEALVNLTSTRRRFTTDVQSVGGETDVAIITKVDGFTWVKKK